MTDEEYYQHWKNYFDSVQREACQRLVYLRRLVFIEKLLTSVAFLVFVLVVILNIR